MRISDTQKRYLATLLAADPKPLSFGVNDRSIAALDRLGLVADMSPAMRATGFGYLSPMFKLTDRGLEVARALAAKK